jgi:uncharacterized OB-fold protein
MPDNQTTIPGEELATDLSRPYWDALRQGRFELQRCTACSKFQHYPRPFCRACDSEDLAWMASSGYGDVVAAVRTHRTSRPERRGVLPFWVILVRLDDGPLLLATGPDDAATGSRVVVDVPATLQAGVLSVRPHPKER